MVTLVTAIFLFILNSFMIVILICVEHWVLILQHSTQRVFKAIIKTPTSSGHKT